VEHLKGASLGQIIILNAVMPKIEEVGRFFFFFLQKMKFFHKINLFKNDNMKSDQNQSNLAIINKMS
jgi:hypothetical protein